MGPPEDFTNYINAVIDEASFDKLKGFIDKARDDEDAEVIFGGNCDKSQGYFIQPTVIRAKKSRLYHHEGGAFWSCCHYLCL